MNHAAKLFAELNREDLRRAAPDSLVVLPLGATEQHGPHLATGTDYFTVEAIAREASLIAEVPTIVTPALPFGSSDHHLVFGGTLSLSTATYYAVLKELLLSLVRDGFRQVFLLNGHGGNHELAQLAVRDVALEHPLKAAAGSYWTIAWDALVEVGAHRERRLPGHAGDFETSMMMGLRPDLVPNVLPHREPSGDSDPRGFSAPWRNERHGSWKEINGFTDSPDQATAAKGTLFRKVVVAEVARAFEEFYRS